MDIVIYRNNFKSFVMASIFYHFNPSIEVVSETSKIPNVLGKKIVLIGLEYSEELFGVLSDYADSILLVNCGIDNNWDKLQPNMKVLILGGTPLENVWKDCSRTYSKSRPFPALLKNLHSAELVAAITKNTTSVSVFEKLFKITPRTIKRLEKEGALIVDYKRAIEERHFKNRKRSVVYNGVTLQIINSDMTESPEYDIHPLLSYCDTKKYRIFTALNLSGAEFIKENGRSFSRNHVLASI